MKILGIETSCDETAVSLIKVSEETNTVTILGNTVHSQIDLHISYGGVMPSLAKREHARNLIPVLEKTLTEAAGSLGAITPPTPFTDEQEIALKKLLALEPELFEAFIAYIPGIPRPDIEYISVTVGPGLEPALWVGINFARALSYIWDIPLVPSNHMEGHILAALIQKIGVNTYDLLDRRIQYPALALLISGGHTQIVLVEKIGSYKIVGETRDDAIGECFDKIARTLGLPYPGGPKISKLAAEARRENIQSPHVLPRPMIATPDFDLSFSGLKTSVLYLVRRLYDRPIDGTLDMEFLKGIAREVEDTITDVIVTKLGKAADTYAVLTLIIGGGVIANIHIREALEKLALDTGLRLLLPQTDHSTDNALMIALAGYFGRSNAVDAHAPLKATGTLPLGERI